jgi:formylglycine-generating enzyme required for sulfatase activity
MGGFNLFDDAGLGGDGGDFVTRETREVIDRKGYRIAALPGVGQSKIGEGASGQVHYALHQQNQQPVAIKVFDNTAEAIEIFQNERSTMRGSDFPRQFAPALFHDWHEEGAQPILILEFIRGQPIDRFVDEHNPPLAERLQLIEQLLDDVQAFHLVAGIAHRDISAGNVLVDERQHIRLLDFGMAAPIIRSAQRNSLPARGNAGYSPKEQTEGLIRAGVPEDIFNCAMLAVHVLTGKTPPRSEGRGSGDPRHLAKCRKQLQQYGVPAGVRTIVLKGLNRLAHRYQKPKDMADALRDYRVARPKRIRRGVVGALMAVAIALLLGVTWWQYAEIQRGDLVRQYTAANRDASQLPEADHPAVAAKLAEAAAFEQQWQEQTARGRHADAAQSLAQATALLIAAKEISLGLERCYPRHEALGIALTQTPWCSTAPEILRRKSELNAAHLQIVGALQHGETDAAWQQLVDFQAELAKLAGENAAAQRVAESRGSLNAEIRTLAPRLKNLLDDAPPGDLARQAEDAWQAGDWDTARLLFGQANQQLARWIEEHETPEERAARQKNSEELLAALTAEKLELETQLQQTSADRTATEKRAADLERQIAELNKQWLADRELMEKAKTFARSESDRRTAAETQSEQRAAEISRLTALQTKLDAELQMLQARLTGALTAQAERDQLQQQLAETGRQLDEAQRQAERWRQAAESNQPDSVARTLADLQTLETAAENLDLTDWTGADKILRDAAAQYQTIAAQRTEALKTFQPTSNTVRAIDIRLAAALEAVKKSLDKRDQVEKTLYDQLEQQLVAARQRYGDLIKEYLPDAEQPRRLQATIKALEAKQAEYRVGHQRADGAGPTPDLLALIAQIPPLPTARKIGDTSKNTIGMEMIRVPAGKYERGARDGEASASSAEKPRHWVQISREFDVGKYPVTQGQYNKVMGHNPSHFSSTGSGSDKVRGLDTTDFPAESVSWFDTIEFCNKLSVLEKLSPYYELINVQRSGQTITSATVKILGGAGYRLLTEAEWEYVARAGTTRSFPGAIRCPRPRPTSTGTTPTAAQPRAQTWSVPESGFLPPKRLGLGDTAGNVYGNGFGTGTSTKSINSTPARRRWIPQVRAQVRPGCSVAVPGTTSARAAGQASATGAGPCSGPSTTASAWPKVSRATETSLV